MGSCDAGDLEPFPFGPVEVQQIIVWGSGQVCLCRAVVEDLIELGPQLAFEVTSGESLASNEQATRIGVILPNDPRETWRREIQLRHQR